MEEAEEHARKMGVVTLHLSTHDKQAFYGHLGYGAGPVVSPRRSCVARLGNEASYLETWEMRYWLSIKECLKLLITCLCWVGLVRCVH